MNEDQKKWLLYLQEKGIKFEVFLDTKWYEGAFFNQNGEYYRIPAQPIPDIPNWREVCMEMYDKGMKFEIFDKWNGGWVNSVGLFDSIIERYRIPQQSLPEWKEEMTEENKFDNLRPIDKEHMDQIKELDKTPHRELQIQWHKDKIRSLETGDPMRQWECRYEPGPWIEFGSAEKPTWQKSHKYRRKPRTVTYWHCAVMFDGLKSEVITGYCKDEVSDQNKRCKEAYPDAKFSPITGTTVEIE